MSEKRRSRRTRLPTRQPTGLYVHSSPPTAVPVHPSIVRQWLRGGEIERLTDLVLQGQGSTLVGEYSPDSKARAFINSLPRILRRIDNLHDAGLGGRINEVEAVLKKEPRFRLELSRDSGGLGLMHKAVIHNHVPLQEWLIKNYPETIQVLDKEKKLPLHYAGGNVDTWNRLVDAGADSQAVDSEGNTPAFYMFHPRRLRPPNPDTRGKKQEQGLVIKPSNIRIWIHDKDLGRLQRVLWEGMGDKLKSETSTQPLVRRFLNAVPYIMGSIRDVHTAAINNDLELLLSKSSDPVPKDILLSKDVNGLSPLHKAAGLGNIEVVREILKKAPEGINSKDSLGRTPLHYAAGLKDQNVMYQLLIDSGAIDHVEDKKGNTPSYYKGKPNDLESSKYLSTIPDAPRTANVFPPSWDWNLLTRGKEETPVLSPVSPQIETIMSKEEIKQNEADMEEKIEEPIENEPMENEVEMTRPETSEDEGVGTEFVASTGDTLSPQSDVNEEGGHGDFAGVNLGETIVLTKGLFGNARRERNPDYDSGNEEVDLKNKSIDKQNDDTSRPSTKETNEEAASEEQNNPQASEVNHENSIRPSTQNDRQTSSNASNSESPTSMIQSPSKDGSESLEREDQDTPYTGEPKEEEVELSKDVEGRSSSRDVDEPLKDDNQINEEDRLSDNGTPGDVDIGTNKRASIEEFEENEAKYEVKGDEEQKEEIAESRSNDVENDGREGPTPSSAQEGRSSVQSNMEEIEGPTPSSAQEGRSSVQSNMEEIEGPTPSSAQEGRSSVQSNMEEIEGPTSAKEDLERESSVQSNTKDSSGVEERPSTQEIAQDENGESTKDTSDENFRDASDDGDTERPETVTSAGGSRAEILAITPAPPDSADGSDTQKAVQDEISDGDKQMAEDLVNSGDMEAMAEMVLAGKGEALLGLSSDNPDVQLFINNVPQYMAKIERVHKAAREGDLRGVQSSLDRRKFAVARDNSTLLKPTPLHVATLFGRTSILRYLAGRFPETMHAQDSSGRSALHYAAVIPDNGHFYSLLVTLGANKSLVDNDGKTAEYYLRNRGELTREGLLEEYQDRPVPIDTSGLNFNRYSDKVANDNVSSRQDIDDESIVAQLNTSFRLIQSKGKGTILHRVLREEVFEEIKLRCTRLDNTLVDLIRPGVKDLAMGKGKFKNKLYTGLEIPDYESFRVFEEIIMAVIKDLNGNQIPEQPPKNMGDEDFNINYDPTNLIIKSFVVEISRNISPLAFPKNLKLSDLEKVEVALSSLLTHYYRQNKESGFIDESGENFGSYYTLSEVVDNKEVFQDLEEEALVAEGYNDPNSENWPFGRGVFISPYGDVTAWINIREHLKLFSVTSSDRRGYLGQAYKTAVDIIGYMDSKVETVRDPILGYLTTDPRLVGNTLCFNALLSLPNLSESKHSLRQLCKEHQLSIQPTRNPVQFRLKNISCLGLTEIESFKKFTESIKIIIEAERSSAKLSIVQIPNLIRNFLRNKSSKRKLD